MSKTTPLTFTSFDQLLTEFTADNENNKLIFGQALNFGYVKDTRETDDKNEQSFDEFLRGTIYPEFINKNLCEAIIPADGKKLQCAGCDAVWIKNNINILVDNKNRTSMLNKKNHNIPLELATENKIGERIDGWFLDKEKSTDYICSMHCFTDDRKQTSFEDISNDDISYMNIFLFKPEDVFGFLEVNANITREFLAELALTVEENVCAEAIGVSVNDIPNDLRKLELCKGATIHSSMFTVKENSTVLLINESVIKMLPSTRHFHWTKDYGLIEVFDKVNRPALTPSEDRKQISFSDVTIA